MDSGAQFGSAEVVRLELQLTDGFWWVRNTKPLPSLTLQATSHTASVAYGVKVDFKAWMLPGPRQKESTIPLGSEKWKAPWHRTAIDRGAWFPTRAGSSPGV